MFNLLLHACAAGAATLALPQDPTTELFGATLHFGDFDRDGAEDIYVSDPVAGDRLLHNRGGGLYEDVTAAHGLDSDARSFFALWFDFDADGAVDLCVGGLDGSLRLLQNADRGHFVDVTPITGLQVDAVGLDAEARDLDGDGRIDLHVSTELGGALFRNAGAGRFERLRLPDVELTALLGVDASAGTAAATGLDAVRDAGSADNTGNADVADDAGRSASRAAAARARRSALAARLAAAQTGAQANAGAASTVPGPPTTSSLLTACNIFMDDFATANCIQTSSVPTLGWLYPLSNELFVATNGRVGMGTTAPETKLHVLNNSAGAVTATSTSIAVLENNANSSIEIITPDANERSILFSGPNRLGGIVHNTPAVPNGFEVRTVSPSGTRMVITEAGNVGIGTTTPGSRLQVVSPLQNVASFRGNHASGAWLELFNTGTGGRSWGLASVGAGHPAGVGAFVIQNNHTFQGLAINTLGDVGIGTFSPDHPLHVVASEQQPVHFVGSHTGGTWLNLTSSAFGGDTWNFISTGSSNSEGAGKLLLRDGDSNTVAMTLQPDGNVGIGTTFPADRLAVVGDTRVTGTTRFVGNVHVDFGNSNAGDLTTGALLFGDQATGEGIAVRKHATSSNHHQLEFYTANTSRMTIDNNGRVGIGRQPGGFAFEVQGDACKTGGSGMWNICSDARIKTDVRTIDSALAVLDELRLVEYRYTDEYLANSPGTADKRYFNVIAQEYAEVFPEYVSTSDADGILKVDTYPALIHAIAAVQELHAIVRAQEAVLAEAAETAAAKDAEIAGLEERLARLEATFERFAATQVSGDGR